MSSEDPHPEFRCRCVNRARYLDGLDHLLEPANPYYDRCPSRPTQEDGLCDHCRQPQGSCDGCGDDRGCCRHPKARRVLVDLMTPCMDKSREAVPF